MQIEDYLYGRKLHLPLLGTKPESMKAEEWALLDRQVLGVIRLTLFRSVAHNVVKENTTADLMKALSDMYEKSSANNKVHLMKKLFNLKMAEKASITQHLNEFNTITNQLSSVKIDFDDEIRALIVLASLPNSWEAIRMAVSNSTGKEKLKYNDIRDLILAEEIRRRDAGETSGSGSTLNLETRGRCNDRNSNQGRSKSRNSNRKISKSILGQQVQCWNCGKIGDFRRQCKSPKKKNEDDSANAVTEEVHDASLLAVDSPLDDWVLDSGASRPDITAQWVCWLLEKVRHILDLGRNLISVGQLDDEGHAILFFGDNGGEYIDEGFSEYCVAQGIRMEKTIPRTPHTAAYLINRGPSVPMEFRLPEEVWSGKEVKFSHLKVFCCVSYVHIDSDARSKLDAKSKICFFIGYGDEKFSYRSTVVLDVTEIDQKKFQFVNLDELTESTVQKGGEEDKENVNSQVDMSTPVAEVRRSSRNIRPPQRYSPILNCLLLTDGGELECYDEALQDENSSK
ncbi:Retrovirus-related Pol polyprotein from transposon TNT 1-94 [Vitis vinifera]|uniref:Retrovirus-related Pol polyprotein from transposon TNT 1-94 n=1 Tax=Vitis vinifera TaxID=29760 RepID=A0A438D011_VITVI|nr:Retrovirus-related Pol polyprotein from transposon TNT 1-94 [Vitis vinifera]